MNQEGCDLLVVGGGAAGLTAALTAREQGAESVVVLESQAQIGGNSRLSSGVIMGSGSRLQQKSGSPDHPHALLRDYVSWNNYAVEVGPVSAVTTRSGGTIDWLQDHGVEFEDELIRCLDELYPRGHCVRGGGRAIVDALFAECRRSGIEFVIKQAARRLLTEDGRVVGVATESEEIPARSVVLATGGFGADEDKVRRYFPSAWVEGLSWYIGSAGAQGGAIDMARSVGARLTGLDTGLRTLMPDFSPQHAALEPLMPGWSVLVDANGCRFVDESAPYGVLDVRTRSVGDRAFLIFDERALAPPDDEVADYRNAYRARWPHRPPFHPINWVEDVVHEMVRRGRVQQGNDWGRLALQLGLPADRLGAELRRYNRMVDRGEDSDQRKPAEFLKPIDQPPYYGVELRPACVNETGFGVRVDAKLRAIHEDGNPIAGLYAAGECAGGLLGPHYTGSGTSLMNACTSGRIAGESAGREGLPG